MDIRFDEYNYHDSLQARAIEGVGHCAPRSSVFSTMLHKAIEIMLEQIDLSLSISAIND